MKLKIKFAENLLAMLPLIVLIVSCHCHSDRSGGDDNLIYDEDDTNPADDTIQTDDSQNDDSQDDDDTESFDDTIQTDDVGECDDDSVEELIWTDPNTGLIWQDGPTVGCEDGEYEYKELYCNQLEWAGYNDWRLPTISELRSLLRGCENTITGGACGLTDDCLDISCLLNCSYCEPDEGPGVGGYYWPPDLLGHLYQSCYWSSSQIPNYSDGEGFWFIGFGWARIIDSYDHGVPISMRCIRDIL
jgi:hypothetical protein